MVPRFPGIYFKGKHFLMTFYRKPRISPHRVGSISWVGVYLQVLGLLRGHTTTIHFFALFLVAYSDSLFI